MMIGGGHSREIEFFAVGIESRQITECLASYDESECSVLANCDFNGSGDSTQIAQIEPIFDKHRYNSVQKAQKNDLKTVECGRRSSRQRCRPRCRWRRAERALGKSLRLFHKGLYFNSLLL